MPRLYISNSFYLVPKRVKDRDNYHNLNPFRHKVKRVTYIQAGHLMPRFLSCNIFKSINDSKINETPSSAEFYEWLFGV